MLCRGPGNVCSTATYQKMICTSCGVLRTSSMKPSAMLRTSQLVDSRMIPTSKPSSVAATMLIADDQQRVQHAHQQGACVGVADGPRYQTERDIEIRRVSEEAEAQRAMPSCRGPGGYRTKKPGGRHHCRRATAIARHVRAVTVA